MKTLLPVAIFLLALPVRASAPEAADFIFPATPQRLREIKMNGQPPLRGKLLLYAPARVHVEKADGSILLVRPSEFDPAELRQFPNTPHSTLADESQTLTAEDAAAKARERLAELELENRVNREDLSRLLFENAALKETNARFARQFAKTVEWKPAPLTGKSSARDAAAVRWRQLAKYTGTGQQTTMPFTITGGEWRIRWTATAQDNFGGFLSVTTRDPEERLLVNTAQPGSDTSYVRGKGRFSLDVASAGVAWTLLIEEAAP